MDTTIIILLASAYAVSQPNETQQQQPINATNIDLITSLGRVYAASSRVKNAFAALFARPTRVNASFGSRVRTRRHEGITGDTDREIMKKILLSRTGRGLRGYTNLMREVLKDQFGKGYEWIDHHVRLFLDKTGIRWKWGSMGF